MRNGMKNPNRMLSQDEVTKRLQEHPDVFKLAKRVGRWVWIEFGTIPPVDIRMWLLDLGFWWNAKREVWQHPCGHPSKASPDDPRWKYGSFPLMDAVMNASEEEIA